MFGDIHEECGVFGICSTETFNASAAAYYALYALQHRGQEACGIAVNDDGIVTSHADMGLVNEVFTKEVLKRLDNGQMAVGHVRYSMNGSANRTNLQPLVVRHVKGPMVVAHNGNITNAAALREKFEREGAIFRSSSDTEVIAYVITKNRLSSPSIEAAIEKAMDELEGAYSMVIMSARKLIAARDPHGFRPLSLGKTSDGSYLFASETCAFETLGAKFVRDIAPGEIVAIENGNLCSITTHCGQKPALCVFEYIYFARPDSVIEGTNVHMARQRAGQFLAQENPIEADVVIGVPDSGLDAAIGYAKESGIPYGVGFVKNRYIGRSFIQPTQALREASVHIKLNPVATTVAGKRVVMVDDSIVRGTTSAKIVKMLREAGAKEVHMRVSCPPFVSPCYFGTDIDDKDKLIACRMTVDEIAKSIGVDSLGYLSVAHIHQLAKESCSGCCTGCFTGSYPVKVPEEIKPDKFEIKFSESEKAKRTQAKKYEE